MSSIHLGPRATPEQRVGVGTRNGRNESSEYALDDSHVATQDTASIEPNTPQQSPTHETNTPNQQEQDHCAQIADDDTSLGRGQLRRLALFLQTAWGSVKGKHEEIRRTVAALSLVLALIGVFGLWPSVRASKDGAKATALAAWDALKNYMEYCEAVCSSIFLFVPQTSVS